MFLNSYDIERFWGKVAEGDNGCWVWKAQTRKGYGIFRLKNRKQQAHRVSYTLVKGDIPDGLVIDHLCRNRKCVNPAHLEAVTNKENILRGKGLCAENKTKTECPKGHKYSDDNTYIDTTGSRVCKLCRRERNRIWMRGKRQNGYEKSVSSC